MKQIGLTFPTVGSGGTAFLGIMNPEAGSHKVLHGSLPSSRPH